MALNVQPLVFDCPATDQGASLKLTVKRYSTAASGSDGLTLLFAHCIGGHKEIWEPVIEGIFKIQGSKPKNHRIREAYSFDRQTHGDAAIINEEALKARTDGVTAFEWASSIAAFVKSHNLQERRTVAIGHSAGAGTLMCSTTAFPENKPPYAAILLSEPTMVTTELYTENIDAHEFATKMACKSSSSRRDTWDDRDSAFEWLTKKRPWKSWDSRAVRLFTEYGLKPSPTGGVTLKCTRELETRTWPDVLPHQEATRLFSSVCKRTPIHIIWGTENDFNPVSYQESLADETAGRKAASVRKVEGAGHLVVQQKPDALAESICTVLDTVSTTIPSKL